MICAKDFSLTYEGQPRPSLRDIHLTINAGDCLLLTGHSACGKSTLLRALSGLIPHVYPARMSGSLNVANCNPSTTPIHVLGQSVGVIYQNPRMQFFCQTVREELAFARENWADHPQEILRDIDRFSAALGITSLLHRNLWELSSGERQRVAIASALVDKTPILLFDEPTANLDSVGVALLRTLLPLLREEGKTLIIAEHRLEFLRDIVERVITLENGTIISEQTADVFWQYYQPSTYTLPSINTNENAEFRYQALNLPPLNCQRGTITALIGTNGSGKTTLLRTLAGLNETVYPVVFEGQNLNATKRRACSFLVMQDIPRQLFSATVREEITLPKQSLTKDEEHHLQHLLHVFSLVHQENQHPQALSGGEQQRVLLATALFSKREICLLDEPTSGLDECSAVQLMKELRQFANAGNIVIVATHDPYLISNADYIYSLPKRSSS